MNKTTYDRGLEQGFERGEARGAQRMLLRAGRSRFDEPSAEIISQIGQVLDVNQLDLLIDRIPDVDSWEELLQKT